MVLKLWLVEGQGCLYSAFLGPGPILGINYVFGGYLLTTGGISGVCSSLEAWTLPLSIPGCFFK